METGKPSWSATVVAMTRAAHLFLDDEPKILNDPFASRFCGIDNESALLATLNEAYSVMGVGTTPEQFAPTYRAFITVRQRYVEDELNKSMELGVAQFVILGAGLDSFAYRRRDLEHRVRVFEVDLPETQQWKKGLLQRLGIAPPDNLVFVPVDFTRQGLMEGLSAYGFRKDIPSMFSWLGVTVYLPEQAIFDTLGHAATAASGSEIIFEYAVAEPLLTESERLVISEGKKRSVEPWVSLFYPSELAKRLQEMGFSGVSDFGAEEAYRLYLTNRIDQLSTASLKPMPVSTLRVCHLMKATVAEVGQR